VWGRAARIEALQLYLAVCWARVITEERLDALVESMPARLQAATDAGEAATTEHGGGLWVRHDIFPPYNLVITTHSFNVSGLVHS